MDAVNPYEPPSVTCKPEGTARGAESFDARNCPCCLVEVTFWAALKQGTPFRYKCPQCRSTFRIQTPCMPLILTNVCFVVFLAVLGVWLGMVKYGLVVLVPAVPLLVTAWIALEIWWHGFLTRSGRFVRIPARNSW